MMLLKKKSQNKEFSEKDVEDFSIEKIRSMTEEGKKKKRMDDFEKVIVGIQRAASWGYNKYNLMSSADSREVRDMLRKKGFEIFSFAGSTYVKW